MTLTMQALANRRHAVITAVRIQVVVLCDVTPRSLVTKFPRCKLPPFSVKIEVAVFSNCLLPVHYTTWCHVLKGPKSLPTTLIHSKTRQVYFDSNCAFTCVIHVLTLLRPSSGMSIQKSYEGRSSFIRFLLVLYLPL